MRIRSTTRFCSLTTGAGDESLLVRRAEWGEGVSNAFCATIELESQRLDLAPADLLGQPAALHVELADGDHVHLHGLVARLERVAATPRVASYRAELRPWTWLLRHRFDCRIFRRQTVPQIVAEVFHAYPEAEFEVRMRGQCPVRDFCVQYRESDHDFVFRLLEQEGLFAWFEHAANRHLLVVSDAVDLAPSCDDGEPLAFDPLQRGDVSRDVVTAFALGRSIGSDAVSLKDYHFEDPGNPLSAWARAAEASHPREVYDYHPADFTTNAAGTRLAVLRLQAAQTAVERGRGRSTCRVLRSGHRFTLRGHPVRGANDQRLWLTAVRHRIEQPSAFADAADAAAAAEWVYENEFECVPAELPYRHPATTPRPCVSGPQTAVVVGPPGEEIHVDQYGRVKVRFHWDRRGVDDDRCSCWVRVAQMWAGQRWGSVAHPRVGDEVVVEFLEGDPDRPIVTGSVYNARRMPPYALPANKTQTGIRTRSSPGGAPTNCNELRFEDRQGQEQVFVQAERDLQFVVKHDRSGSVGNDEQVQVGNDRTASVGGNDSTSIGGKRNLSVGGDETVSVGGNASTQIAGNEGVSVGGSATEQVGAAKVLAAGSTVLIQAGTSITLQCGASSLHMNQAGFITLSGMVVNIVGAVNANMTAPITNVVGAVMSTNSGAVNVVTGGVVARVMGAQVEAIASGDNVVRGGTVKINT